MLDVPSEFSDEKFKGEYSYPVDLAHVGQGNWRAFRAIGISLPELLEIARGWANPIQQIDRPWLCWHVDPDWCLVQQRLATLAGWTPVVGFDPRVGPPPHTVPGAVVVDFNKELNLPVLYPHFVLEFAFLFCKKIAFWHSDLLVREEKLRHTASLFESLEDGATAAVRPRSGWRYMFTTKYSRYWELIGCTTEKASKSQFDSGCGWWMDYWAHPNQRNAPVVRQRYYWDHGSGIYYWHRKIGGRCVLLSGRDFREGHFTKIGNPNYNRYREPDSGSDARRSMASEIRENFDLVQACQNLGLERLLLEPL